MGCTCIPQLDHMCGPYLVPPQGISLRDLKLENILLRGSPTKPIVKLCDMGFSKSDVLHSAPDSTVGTLAYTAPEVGFKVGTTLCNLFFFLHVCTFCVYLCLAVKGGDYTCTLY